ncbi:addiction module antitoxin [Staphylococcus hominis]|uniref:AbrB/MazE/SpoVT family DNA-binding domain-containing protein n=2 Tax=Staphylococcus hominis TaxID=1290 RepID=UPI001F5814DD|nr:addiction module antitoxin [Staphylococcus hominis]MCI2919792.1 addiction module antitoxin [Staphylococcus hominis]MDS3915134.1 addiction module antitoxin [Staphylococcus hominis]
MPKENKLLGGLQMVATRKLRRAGNSSVVSVPTEVITALRMSDGDNLKFNIEDNKVTIEKEVSEDEEFYRMLDETFAEYNQALRKMVDL